MLRIAIESIHLRAPPLHARMSHFVGGIDRGANLAVDHHQCGECITLLGRCVQQRKVAHRTGRGSAVYVLGIHRDHSERSVICGSRAIVHGLMSFYFGSGEHTVRKFVRQADWRSREPTAL